VLASTERLRIGTVGGGAGGVEVTLAAQHALRGLLRERGAGEATPEFHLFTGGSGVLPTHNERVREKFVRTLSERDVQLHTTRVEAVRPGSVRQADGVDVALDEIIWATEAGAVPWLRASGLNVDERGFVQVSDTLESTSHSGIFAAGDIASSVNHPREKAGVFAVRQGKPLAENLRRAVLDLPLRPFQPQEKFLSLISTGDRYAVASRGRWSTAGRWVWRWKDRIDRRFMDRYNTLPEMPEKTEIEVPGAPSNALDEISRVAMRCGGCGAKVGATVLTRVLARLPQQPRNGVVLGMDEPDDAAVTSVPPGKVVGQTVDSFRAIVDDPYIFGKITTNHSLNDIFAMGAEPRSALAIATIPYGVEAKVEDTLEQMLLGAVETLGEANVVLAGGHTSEGAELSLGFAVTGIADESQLLRKSGLRPGDRLILTKAIGTGTLFAADMRLKAKGRWIAGAIQSMLVSSEKAAACLRRHGAVACTDVTGFGLLGHLIEMTRASRVDARVLLDELPVLEGARETAAAGLLSSLQPENLRLRRGVRATSTIDSAPLYPLLFDPQTAGGLLAGIPETSSAACVDELHQLGYQDATVIGLVEERSDHPEPIVLESGGAGPLAPRPGKRGQSVRSSP
jgi:selenide,water dikinase